MHTCHALRDVGEDLQDLRFRQPVLQPCIHEVDETTSRAELHQQEDLVSAALELRRVRVDVLDDVPVTLQLLHGLHLRPHVRERSLVRDGHPLQHSRLGSIDGVRESDDVDVGEATFGKVLLDDDTVVAYLDLRARQEGASWRAGGLHRSRRIVRRSMTMRESGVRVVGVSLGVIGRHAAESPRGARRLAVAEVIVTA